jgi:hypothetical protein
LLASAAAAFVREAGIQMRSLGLTAAGRRQPWQGLGWKHSMVRGSGLATSDWNSSSISCDLLIALPDYLALLELAVALNTVLADLSFEMH